MGVLEARRDAEKVGYPVIGEEKKDASNVIDYDIHEEITKDTSAIINANNQTTTGMATVIPGVNAPKLIADTSIYGMGVSLDLLFAKVTGSVLGHDAGALYQFTSFSFDDASGFDTYNDEIIIPSPGVYSIEYTTRGQQDGLTPDGYRATYYVKNNGTIIAQQDTEWRVRITQKIFYKFNKGDVLTFYESFVRTLSARFYCSISIVKLG